MAASIPNDGPNSKTYLPKLDYDDTIFIAPTTVTEISKIISKLKSNTPGHDEISLVDIKPVLNSLINPLLIYRLHKVYFQKN